jgi:hypothetical protein
LLFLNDKPAFALVKGFSSTVVVSVAHPNGRCTHHIGNVQPHPNGSTVLSSRRELLERETRGQENAGALQNQ